MKEGCKPLKQDAFRRRHQEVSIWHFAGLHILTDSCHSMPNGVHCCS